MKKKKRKKQERIAGWNIPLVNKDSIKELRETYRINFKGRSWFYWGFINVEVWEKCQSEFSVPCFRKAGFIMFNPKTGDTMPLYYGADVILASYIEYLYRTKIEGKEIKLK